jgi:hypothetical protein
MFTMVINSFTATPPSCPQSPTHGGNAVAVGLGVTDIWPLGVRVAVLVGDGVSVRVRVAVGVEVRAGGTDVEVAVTIGVGVRVDIVVCV